MILTTPQQNEILNAIRAGYLDPASCKLQDPFQVVSILTLTAGNSKRARVTHQASGSAFTLWRDTQLAWNYRASIKVGRTDSFDIGPCEWSKLVDNITTWAEEVSAEIDAPDLWAELHHIAVTAEPTPVGDDIGSTPFTSDEQAEVSERLDQVKEQVRETAGLADAQLRAIEQAFEELKDSASNEKISRKDWKLLLYGQAMNLYVAYAIPPHVVQEVINTVISGLGHLLGVGGLPSAIPPLA